jgi:hypothetical protein
MIALLCFFLTLFEAVRRSADRVAAEGALSYRRRSLVPGGVKTVTLPVVASEN